MTWHKLLERVCDVTVTPAPPAAGETRQYVYDVFDVNDVSDLNDRLPGACE
ncbi:hypothetical protein [Streptomyces sp. NPDC046859]|uniref:hypothetical protein n=1 Tax=Streptomyces sp. NPDC046859 TaxID=3155734 RepID=UPI0033EDE581